MTTAKNGPQQIETRIGALEFTHDFANGLPTDATLEKLYDERDFQRACQAYLWSLPAVSFAAWQRGITKGLGARNGQIVAILSYEARHPDRQCHHAVLPRVRRPVTRPVGVADAGARRARRDLRRMADGPSGFGSSRQVPCAGAGAEGAGQTDRL
jgi:hypothetical protein